MRANYTRWSHLSALTSSMVILLQLIDCSQPDAQQTTAIDQLEAMRGIPSEAPLDLERINPKLKMKESGTREKNHQSSRDVVPMKRSAPIAPIASIANDGLKSDMKLSGKLPIDVKRADGSLELPADSSNSQDHHHLELGSSLLEVEALERAQGDGYSDSDFAKDLDDNFPNANKNNFLAKLKSFIELLSDKIILSVNNLKAAEQGDETQDTNRDQTTLIERRKKRLSKEIVQIIQDDIHLAGASNKSEKAKQIDKQITKTSNNNSIKSTQTLKSMLSGKNIAPSEQTGATPIKSTSAIWKHNLESLLKDQDLRIENSTFDLGHIKRLHQRGLADTNSLTPIAQLKEKVMSFMHFG